MSTIKSCPHREFLGHPRPTCGAILRIGEVYECKRSPCELLSHQREENRDDG